jgi:hypothetical protein
MPRLLLPMSARTLAAMALLAATTGCTDNLFGPRQGPWLADAGFNTTPAGFDLVTSSYAADPSGMPWGGPMRGRDGFGPGMGMMMGGGMHENFLGAEGQGPGRDGRGRGPDFGPFRVRIDSSCTVGGGNVTCGPSTRGGLTVTTVYTLTGATGAAQTRLDSTTNTVRTRSTVTGTAARGREGSVSATVNNSSDRTVTGLAAGSAQRTVNGWSRGSENSSGTNRDGKAFTSVRTSADTTTGLVIPTAASGPSYPSAGRVVRAMVVTMTVDGSTTTRNRREVVTYDGSATAKVTITEDGTTKNCTMPLPRGRPTCG